ncbi:hypothetical protein PAMP_005460 [Pampus punctatissimus]
MLSRPLLVFGSGDRTGCCLKLDDKHHVVGSSLKLTFTSHSVLEVTSTTQKKSLRHTNAAQLTAHTASSPQTPQRLSTAADAFKAIGNIGTSISHSSFR